MTGCSYIVLLYNAVGGVWCLSGLLQDRKRGGLDQNFEDVTKKGSKHNKRVDCTQVYKPKKDWSIVKILERKGMKQSKARIQNMNERGDGQYVLTYSRANM